jgi:hypothetical protein
VTEEKANIKHGKIGEKDDQNRNKNIRTTDL